MKGPRRRLALGAALISMAPLWSVAASFSAPAPPAKKNLYQPKNEQEIRRAFGHVLAAEEYRTLRRATAPEEPKPAEAKSPPTWLERLVEWLARWLSSSEKAGDENAPASLNLAWIEWVLYLLVGTALLSVGGIMWKAILRRSAHRAGGPTTLESSPLAQASSPPGQLPPSEYLARALELAGAGDYKRALRQILLGAMSWTERRGWIRYRRGLTNYDYLQAIADRAASRSALEEIIVRFEEVYYGRRKATRESFEQCLHRFKAAFSEGVADGSAAP